MLFLIFQLGGDRYALEAARVVEVVPLVELKKLPQAPRGVSSIFNYRGESIPAVDLCELTLGQPTEPRLSTRIIVIRHPDAAGRPQLLGLVAEHATELIRKETSDFKDITVNLKRAPYLGPVLLDPNGSVQWVHEQRLLPEPVRNLLFSNLALYGR